MEVHEKGEVLTGIFYVDTQKPDFASLLNLVDEPLATLPRSARVPGARCWPRSWKRTCNRAQVADRRAFHLLDSMGGCAEGRGRVNRSECQFRATTDRRADPATAVRSLILCDTHPRCRNATWGRSSVG